MKKTLHTLLFACLGIFAGAQNSIPNGNFENWITFNYDQPLNYPAVSNPEAFFRCGAALPNTIKTTDAYSGSYAIKMTTLITAPDTCFGYVVNTNPNGNFPNWPGGFAYNQMPTGIRGYYKCAVASPDTARLLLIFKSGGNPIGTYLFPFYGTQAAYTLFNFALSPALPSTPDTVIFAAASSDFSNSSVNLAGSMLQIDSVSFTGGVSQPLLFNGSFENWTSNTLYKPVNWYTGGWEGQGMTRTTDAAAGNYAAELTTYLGDNNGNPRASGGQVSTGYYLPGPCSPCVQLGGYPFSNQIDTLVFAYKYAPMSNDSAEVMLTFKNSGTQIGWASKRLGAAATYQTVEIPFNVGSLPDTVIVQAQSSLWQDSALTYIGSDLKIDEIHFKSQPLTTSAAGFSIENNISVYPNPSAGEFNVQSPLFKIQNVEVYNAIGEKVTRSVIPNGVRNFTIDLTNQPKGIYLAKMTSSNGKIFTKKIIVSK